MIKVYPATSRYSADPGWLQSNFSFSFADYYDPDNIQFGPLRVFNDDTVQPGKGFGMHPHREMEIVTVPLQGSLKHEDSTGTSAILSYGEVQRMSAGTGILHSEVNASDTEEVKFLQLWFVPDAKGIEPSYEQKAYEPEKLVNRLHPVVSGNSEKAECVMHIHQNMTIYLSDMQAGQRLTFSQEAGRRIYLFVIEGDLDVQGEKLSRRDAARITELSEVELFTEKGVRLMLIDLP
jgi:redox-sensitive bicupin YhaK (pirin superfamily)